MQLIRRPPLFSLVQGVLFIVLFAMQLVLVIFALSLFRYTPVHLLQPSLNGLTFPYLCRIFTTRTVPLSFVCTYRRFSSSGSLSSSLQQPATQDLNLHRLKVNRAERYLSLRLTTATKRVPLRDYSSPPPPPLLCVIIECCLLFD